MRRFKRLAFSFLFLTAAGFFCFVLKATFTDEKPYLELVQTLGLGNQEKPSITQTKSQVVRSYWMLNAENSVHLCLSYPSSLVFQGDGLVEEINQLKAEAKKRDSYSCLTSETGSLDFQRSRLIATSSCLEHFKNDRKDCKAYAKEVLLDIKQKTPTFVAKGVKAEITP